MKKWLSTTRQVFRALQVCCVLAMAGGVFFSGLPQMLYYCFAYNNLLQAEDVVISVIFLALFTVMWADFFRMCGRLARQERAFTRQNANTLRLISLCCGGLAVLMLAVSLAPMVVLMLSGDKWFIQVSGVAAMSSMVPTVFLVAIFAGGCLAAMVLRRLLCQAMALQQEADETV
ncbi:MAG: DUF2975 domain-containing protein [Clostridiales bacterium]|nr:DUF2975 domain-containing protein [Clostridiales bacterium]